jgi:hypothetical protein
MIDLASSSMSGSSPRYYQQLCQSITALFVRQILHFDQYFADRLMFINV